MNTILRAACVAALAVAAGGCADRDYAQIFGLKGITRDVDGASLDNGRVAMLREDALIVHLESDPSTGYRWELVPLTPGAVTSPVLVDYVARTAPAAAGASGETIVRIRGVAVGTAPVELVYRRPFEAAVPPAKTVRFEVAVQ